MVKMGSGTADLDDMYLHNLEEYVNDENKLVTYKWLSHTLQVHVNLAKQMLFAFVENQRNKKDNDQLAVTYAVSGQAADKHGNLYNKIQVVREEELEAAKSQLKKVTSCHIYCIQKSKLQDTNPLYTTDYSIFKEDIYSSNRFSSIVCQSVVSRDTDELESLRKTVMPAQSEPAFSAEKESQKMNGVSKAKNGTATNKQAGIAGMFNNARPKASKKDEGDAEERVALREEKSTSKPSKNVMAFFSNHAVKPKKEPVQENETKETKNDDETQSANQTKQNVTKKIDQKKASNSRKKAVLSDEEDPLPERKRRRIKQKEWESSSEEEEDVDMDVEAPIPSPPRSPTPPPREASPSSPIPPTPQEETKTKKVNSSDSKVKGKRRKRVQKTKSYQNEEGYFVTEKVWEIEYSDCSDDDVVEIKEETKVKVESPSKSNKNAEKKVEEKKNKSPPSKKGKAASNTKQMSMMNFFKKK